MTDNTPNLGLPYLMAAQAQKHVTHNEALRALDAMVQLSVLDKDLTSPPASPTNGERYIIAANATGAWLGKDKQIAAFQDNAWMFYAPLEGWLAWVADEDKLLAWDGTSWIIAGGQGNNPTPLLGVNATADASNRLTVSSPASLFNHEGAGHQLKVNKNTVADTASLLFQTGFSGRAEFGLAGDNDWHVKVSPDGTAWQEALIADKSTGAVRFPVGLEHAASRKPVSSLIFTPGGDGQVSIFRNDRVRSADPRQATISLVSGDVITLTTNDSNLFYWSIMRDVSYVRIWNISKAPAQAAWIKWDPAVNQVQVTDAAHLSGWSAGEIIQLGDIPGAAGVPAGFTRGYAIDISPMMQNMIGAIFPQAGLAIKVVAFGVGARAGSSLSPNGTVGSYVGGNSLSNGDPNVTSHTVPCSELSPISNSNLLFLREDDAGSNTISISAVSVIGVYG